MYETDNSSREFSRRSATHFLNSRLTRLLGVLGIAVVPSGGDFVDECLFVGDAAIEALGR